MLPFVILDIWLVWFLISNQKPNPNNGVTSSSFLSAHAVGRESRAAVRGFHRGH